MRKSDEKYKEEREKKISFLISIGFTEEDAFKNRLKVSSCNSYLYWMYKYKMTKEDACMRVSLLQKEKSPRCKEYWIKRGNSIEESILLVSKYQDNVSLSSTINKGQSLVDYKNKCKNRIINKDKYISLYGKEEGIKKWMDKKDKSRITIDNMIMKYGDLEGRVKWNNYINNQKKAHSESSILERHGEKNGNTIIDFRKNLHKISRNNYINSDNSKFGGFSKSSQRLFWSIYNRLPDHLKDKCYFKELNKEFSISVNKSFYLYDFVISNINLCIEFNGDIWHVNPNRYKKDDFILLVNKLASDIWYKDENKIKILKNNRNIDTIIIWESDWIKNKNDIEIDILNSILELDAKRTTTSTFS